MLESSSDSDTSDDNFNRSLPPQRPARPLDTTTFRAVHRYSDSDSSSENNSSSDDEPTNATNNANANAPGEDSESEGTIYFVMH